MSGVGAFREASASVFLRSPARRVGHRTGAREVEVHEPLAAGLLVRRSELPLSGGFAGDASEVLAWPGVVEAVIDHVTRRVDRDAHCNLYVSVNGGECAVGDVGYLFVNHVG